jgi:hypothetical protein
MALPLRDAVANSSSLSVPYFQTLGQLHCTCLAVQIGDRAPSHMRVLWVIFMARFARVVRNSAYSDGA